MSDELKAGKIVRIGDGVTLILGDCLDVLPALAGIDAVVTDPPYGIAYEASRYRGASFSGVMQGDDSDFDPQTLLALKKPTIIWGANNFSDRLPRGGWIVWDKRCCVEADRAFGSAFELAWISDCSKFKMLRLQHGGALNADGRGIAREHPTQKPIGLMKWCIGFVKGQTICDPYMGSGTTGIACIRTGRKFIGIERDPVHFATAEQRIRRELEAGTFDFTAQPASASQQPLL
jgi:DNA modification methylase